MSDLTLTGISQTVFTLSIIVLNLALFFRWLTLGTELRRYRGVALGCVFIALLFQLPIFINSPGDFSGWLLALTLLGLFKIYLTAGVGLHFTQALQLPYFRPGGLTPTVRSSIKQLLMPQPNGWFVAVLASLTFTLVFSILLFRLSGATPTALVLDNLPEHQPSSALLAVTVLVVAFAEEILFRLGLQNWLSYSWGHSRRSQWVAILVSTTIWTLGHTGLVEPAWVKFLQMFIMGLLLGVLNQRFGILACIAVHGLFNVIATINQDWFM